MGIQAEDSQASVKEMNLQVPRHTKGVVVGSEHLRLWPN